MEYPTYLIHYGIPGQKWGNRRWQYEDGSLTPEGYIHYGYGKRESTKQKIEYLGSRDRINSGKATKKDLSKLNGSVYIKDLDNMYMNYGYQFTSDNQLLSIGMNKINNLINNPQDSNAMRLDNVVSIKPAYTLKKNQKLNLDDDLIMKSINRRINPNYGEKGTTNNCVRCTTAMTLAKMGYSTPSGLAAGRALYGAESSGFSYWFDGAKMNTVNTIVDAETELKSQPKGAFGEFAVSRYDANGNRLGGHSMAYSILSDGSIRIEDSQNGSMYKSIEDAMQSVGASEKQIMITRLDNTKPNIDHISEDNMIDIGGSRNSNPTYVQKDLTHVTYNKNNNRIENYSWKNSGRSTDYKNVGKDETGALYGKPINRDVIFDNYGSMYLKEIGNSHVGYNEEVIPSRIKTLLASGKTQDQVSNILGVSLSTVNKYKWGI